MIILAFLLIVTVVIAICYVRHVKVYSYWNNRGINGPKPYPYIGNVTFNPDDTLMIHNDLVKEYGEIYGTYLFSLPVLTVARVDMIKEILIQHFHKFSDQASMTYNPLEKENLINKNGYEWKSDRDVMSPSFSSGKMKAMFHLMRESYQHLDRELEKVAGPHRDIDSKEIFSKLSTMVISRCAFATDVDAFNDKNNQLIKHMESIFHMGFSDTLRLLTLLSLPDSLNRLLQISFFKPAAMQYLKKVCEKILHERRSNPSYSNEYPDLLQLLMEAKEKSNGQFNDTKIIANSILFFIAGYETTSTLLFWASYALVTNPLVQEKLYEEVKRVKQESGDFDYETLYSMKYLDAFIRETLRMYPPVVRFLRRCIEDHTFSNGMKVEKGTLIVVPIYYIHHCEDNYPHADTFDPDRFMAANKDSVDRCAFLAFVEGPRNCIGMRFALLEAKLALANLILKYRFEKSPCTPEKLVFDGRSFVLAVKEMPIRMVKRQS